MTKEAVYDLVSTHHTAFSDAVVSENYFDVCQLEGVLDIYTMEGYVDFSCGWSGFASQTDSTGFYYIETDDPAVIFPSDLSVWEDGWLWDDPDSDNTCYLEKICDHFYYYDLHL